MLRASVATQFSLQNSLTMTKRFFIVGYLRKCRQGGFIVPQRQSQGIVEKSNKRGNCLVQFYCIQSFRPSLLYCFKYYARFKLLNIEIKIILEQIYISGSNSDRDTKRTEFGVCPKQFQCIQSVRPSILHCFKHLVRLNLLRNQFKKKLYLVLIQTDIAGVCPRQFQCIQSVGLLICIALNTAFT